MLLNFIIFIFFFRFSFLLFLSSFFLAHFSFFPPAFCFEVNCRSELECFCNRCKLAISLSSTFIHEVCPFLLSSLSLSLSRFSVYFLSLFIPNFIFALVRPDILEKNICVSWILNIICFCFGSFYEFF